MAPASSASTLGLIGISGRKFIRISVLTALIAGVFALSGCGDDDDEPSTAPAVTATETDMSERAPTETEAETETETETETEPPVTETAPPEDMPGGAGDEEPARTLALFTARGGRITPRVVRVPAFISIQVELRSADDATYTLTFGDATLKAGGELSSVSTTLDGLRPGEAVVGRPGAAGNRVRVEATAEPGP
jgi:hypothetical protein